ncbi:sphinganine C4-monooxygenase 1-like [Carica papaya]|uniref:sphinganine C4-monooxygenase 1-like n=1 Tax=Carica papaya TaxID=3649 RepID=UPI000B8C7ECB|nr:sphinganine C4-monooxygenase 1-like [Carica papaya]
MVLWEGYVSDETMCTFGPIVAYWVYAGIYQLLPPPENYRLHPKREQEDKNSVSISAAVKGVLLQQLIQATVAQFVLLYFTSSEDASGNSSLQPSLLIQTLQFIIAMLVMDTWQYFVHRYMHHNKFLYRRVHSQHHRLVVPFAFGALYNHPFEGLLDNVGGAVSFLVSGMTARTAVFFFCFAVIKTVDDHCGFWFPGNIFHVFFHNNSAYHDIHHQPQGARYNYSQPFLSIWDRLLGTHMPYEIVKRTTGGFEVRPRKKVAVGEYGTEQVIRDNINMKHKYIIYNVGPPGLNRT